MQKKYFGKKALVFGMVFGLFFSSTLSVAASGKTRDELKSFGRICLGSNTSDSTDGDALFDADDLYYIADRIDVLKEACR